MRKLVTVRKIDNILPIQNADAIEQLVIDGWNVVAQVGYGKGIRHLNYGALADCLNKISKGVSIKTIGLPFKLGADRAGGDWNIILELAEYFLADFNVVIYELES